MALAASWGCLADTSHADVDAPGDSDVVDAIDAAPDLAPDPADLPAGEATPPDDGNPPDAFPSDGADDTCHPSRLPACTRDGVPVSCDLAVAYQNGWSSLPTSPRGLCESLCDRGYGLDSLNQSICLEYGGCWSIEGLDCDACCTLSYLPPSARPNDDDPCTADACAGDTCTHDPYEWIGQPCEVRNDFGACTGLLSCDSWCPTDSLDCKPGVHRCTALTPDADLVNGIDDDCDGTTDEGAKDGVLRLSEDGDVLDPSLAALTDGRFVVAWRTCVSPNFYTTPTCQVHLRTGTRDDPLGGLPVTPDEGDSSAPCLWPLADGRFAVAWNSTDDTDPRPPDIAPRNCA